MKLFLLILLILIIPIPIKISISYTKENYYIKIYKFIILKKHSFKKASTKNKKKACNKKHHPKKKYNKKFTLNYLIKITKALNNNPFKPKLKFKADFQYSLNDACKTAIFYGLLQNIAPYILEAFKIPFKIKSFKLFIKPIFKDEFIRIFNGTCIIFVSIGKTIIMICLILKEIANR